MCKLTISDKNKLGNTAIYMADRIKNLSKTKFLKLLYLVEEHSVKQFKTPFLGLPFEVWKAGPVAKEVFVDLSDDLTLLGDYVKKEYVDGDKIYIHSVKAFCDDEFSDNDMNVLDSVVSRYGGCTAKALVKMLHQEGSLWKETVDENNLMSLLDEQHTSDVKIDMGRMLDAKDKEFYEEQMEFLKISRTYNH